MVLSNQEKDAIRRRYCGEVMGEMVLRNEITVTDVIAEVEAERKRCAEVVESAPVPTTRPDLVLVLNAMKKHIAQAILNGGE